MRKLLIVTIFLLVNILVFSQEGGLRSFNVKSDKFIHSDFIGLGGKLVYVDTYGNEIPLTIDFSTIFLDNDTLSVTPPYVLPTASTLVLGGVKVDGTTITISDGVISSNGGYAPPQVLTGTTPTYSANNGLDATISLTGNTTITMANLQAGMKGTLVVTNTTATPYTLNVTGYTNAIHKAIGTVGNYTKLNVTGVNKLDSFSWFYTGTILIWNGGLDYIKQ